MPQISLIIPVYNVESYLSRCLESVIRQSFIDFEAILVDDASMDQSSQICQECIKKDNRFIYARNDVNQGLGIARNVGLSLARGKFVVFIDSDDFIEDRMLEHLISDAETYRVDTVIAGFKRVYKNKTIVEKNPFAGQIIEQPFIKTDILEKMFGKYHKDKGIEMSVWKTLFSMEIIRKNEIIFPDRAYLSEDIMFDISYYTKAERVYMSEDIGYCYCFNKNSLTQKFQKKKFELLKFQYLEMKRNLDIIQGGIEAYLRADYYLVGNAFHYLKLAANNCHDYKNSIQLFQSFCRDKIFCNVNWNSIYKSFKFYERIAIWLLRNGNAKGLFCYVICLNWIRGLKND